jgi:hypothetical protein
LASNCTIVAPVNPDPLMVMTLPGWPDEGEKPVIVSPRAARQRKSASVPAADCQDAEFLRFRAAASGRFNILQFADQIANANTKSLGDSLQCFKCKLDFRALESCESSNQLNFLQDVERCPVLMVWRGPALRQMTPRSRNRPLERGMTLESEMKWDRREIE